MSKYIHWLKFLQQDMILLSSKSTHLSPSETQDGQFASLKQHNLEHSILAEGTLWSDMAGMAFPVVEFSRQGYKIRKVFG